MSVLGSPLGSDRFVNEHADSKVITLSCLLERVSELHDSQIELLLLRSCTGFPKITHLLRTCAPLLIKDAINTFDRAVDESILHILGDNVAADFCGRSLSPKQA
jgi:glutamate racemase